MALVLADRVKETTTTTGTGTVTLAGASAGYRSFATVGNGNTTYYTISGQTTSEWEVGIGTYTTVGTTLSRTTVLSSSNAGSLVVFSAGTKDVFVTYPAGRSVNVDAANTVVSVPQLSATSIINSGLTSGRVVYSTTGGLETDSANLTFDGTNLSLAGGTANGVTYLNASKVLTSGTALTFDGSILTNTGVGYYINNANALLRFGNAAATRTGYLQVRSDAFEVWSDQAAVPMVFGTSNAERMRLDTSGNVGIGTSSPGYKLQVSSGATASTSYFSSTATPAYSTTAYNGGNARIAMVGGGASGATTGINFSQGGSFELYFGGVQEAGGAAAFVFQGYNGSAYAERMRIDSSGNVGIGTSSPGGKLDVSSSGQNIVISRSTGSYGAFQRIAPTGQQTYDFYTINGVEVARITGDASYLGFATGSAATERMRIDSSGNLLVGTTDSSGGNTTGFEFYYGAGSSRYYIGHITGTASGTNYIQFNYNGAGIGSITQSGTTAVLYNVTSDQRLKENIVDAPEFGSVIDSLQVRQFDWKTDNTHQRYGFIAQELVTVAPEAVHQPANPEEMMAVDYSKLVPMLVKEIQSLRKRLTALESR